MNPSIFVIGIMVLIVLYMTHPRFLKRRISSARFFKDLPPSQTGKSRFKFGKMQLILPFFLQLSLLILMLTIAFFPDKKLSGISQKNMGIWFVMDTSASMSTLQKGKSRIILAKENIEAIVSKTQKEFQKNDLFFNLSAMDMEHRQILTKGTADELSKILYTIKPRPLGTDIGIIRRLSNQFNNNSPSRSQSFISHLVVVTDIPAPAWLGDCKGIKIIWQDISQPVNNIGFSDIKALRNPLTGKFSEILAEVTAYGQLPANTKLIIKTPDGNIEKKEVLNLPQGKVWNIKFLPDKAGLYQFNLSPSDSYIYDNEILINIDESLEIRVDWQFPQKEIPNQMGWTHDSKNPNFRVTTDIHSDLNIPTLIIGPGYQNQNIKKALPNIIRDFSESSPLLKDINLDAIEAIEMPGIHIPIDFQPVLSGMDGKVWMAQAENPLRAYIPGLPTGTDDLTGRISTTIFFNALRWLMENNNWPALYTLTSPQNPNPGANCLVLHKDEGNTQRIPQSSGKISDIKPIEGEKNKIPLWPILLMVIALIFITERTISTYSYDHT